jgi:hypothetical protein
VGDYVCLRAVLDHLPPVLRRRILKEAVAVYGHGEVRSYVLPHGVAEQVQRAAETKAGAVRVEAYESGAA